MSKFRKPTIIVFATIFVSSFFYLYIWKYIEKEPSKPFAENITPTPSITLENNINIDNLLDEIADQFNNSALAELLDGRYLGINNESDPIWTSEKDNYQLAYIGSAASSTATSHNHNDLYYLKNQISDLLDDKSDTDHSHNSLYYTETEIDSLLTSKSSSDHNHDDRYYTDTEVDTFLSQKANLSHTHNDLYYTETETDTLLGQKASSSHTHDDRYYTKSEMDTTIDTNTTTGAYTTLLPIQKNYSRIDPMESGWSSFYGNGTISFDTTDYLSGTGALKIVTSSNATNSGARKTLSGNEDWSGKSVKISVKVDNWDNLQEVKLLISTNGQFVSYYQVNLKTFLTYPSDHNNEWYEFIVPTSAFTTSGTPSWTTVNQLIVRGIGVNGQTPTIRVDEYATFSNPSTGMLSFTFDDGHSSDYNQARQVMDTYGYKGTIYLIPSIVDTSGRLTQTQVDFLHNAGWDISGHGNSDLTEISTTAAEADILDTKQYLQLHGYRGADLYAYPNGGHNATIRNMVEKYFSIARTIAPYSQPIYYMNPTMLNSKVVHSTDSTSTVNGWIDTASTNKEWLILTFHRITDTTPASSTEYLKTDFQSIVDHAYSSGLQVLPMSQALRRLWSF